MKFLLLLGILLMPFSVSAENFVPQNVWFCKAVGNIGKDPVIVLTNVWADPLPNHYEKRQAHFAHFVQILTKGQFRPSFVAKCRDYTDAKRAIKHQREEIKLAKKYEFRIVETSWSYKLNEKSGE